jgi:molybdate transport system substrate-binding protein
LKGRWLRSLALLPAVALLPAAALLPAPAQAGEGAASAPRPIVVYAAASLSEVLQQLAADFHRAGGPEVRISFASTAVLARQIEAGAPADVFIAADRAWMDYLRERSLLQDGSERALAGNRLVLIAPADSPVRPPQAGGAALLARAPLLAALGSGRLATGDPDAVPLGRYARAALQRLALWDELGGRLVRADDARSALAFVARGEAPLGIVYATDARSEPRARRP